jgi:hypothetical protein
MCGTLQHSYHLFDSCLEVDVLIFCCLFLADVLLKIKEGANGFQKVGMQPAVVL